MKRVYFYTGKSVHNIHRQEYKAVPEGFEYVPGHRGLVQRIGVHKSSKPSLMSRVKGGLSQWAFRSVLAAGLPKAHYRRVSDDIDLIHSTHHPLLNRRTPWVLELEEVTQLTWYNRRLFDKPRNKRFFERMFRRDACKGILCWTEAAKTGILNGLNCEGFKDKIQVVPLTMEPNDPVERTFKKDRINLFFLSTVFDNKGGMETILATVELAKSYDVHLIMASSPPDEIRQKFENHPHIHFDIPKTREALIQMYKDADIFVMPGHFEALGFVFLEAFSYGLPCIAADGYAAEDLIEDGVRGRVIQNWLSIFDEQCIATVSSAQQKQALAEQALHPPQDYVMRLAKAIEDLIKNPELREQMSRNAYESVVSGKFSQAHRRKLLKEIYSR